MLNEKDEISYLLERKLELMRMKESSVSEISCDVYDSEIKVIDQILKNRDT